MTGESTNGAVSTARPRSRGAAGPRLVIVLVLGSLALSLAVTLAVGGGTQVFAAAGTSRRLVLPLVYLAAAVIVLRLGTGGRRLRIGPLWLWLPLLLAGVSALANLGGFLADGLPVNAVQGVLLLGGFTLLGVCGAATGRWGPRERYWLLVGATVAALLAASLRTLVLTPYGALVVPAAFLALLMTVHGRRHRLAWGAATVALVVLGSQALRPGPGLPVSIAVLGQIAVCAGVVVTALLPRTLRAAALTVGTLGLLGVVALPGVTAYLSGDYTGDDVTLTQRAYETQQVLHEVQETALGPLVGRGPAATVDLTSSPDRETLRQSGRDLTAVDDVHLVTSYVILKTGALGLLWWLWLLVVVVRALWSALAGAEVDVWRAALLLFVTSGLVAGFPAGTETFSNPLLPLLLGVLWAERRADSDRPHRSVLHLTHRTTHGGPTRPAGAPA
jgi:hypothetical protein